MWQVSRTVHVPVASVLMLHFFNRSKSVRDLPAGTHVVWPSYEQLQTGAATNSLMDVTVHALCETHVDDACKVLQACDMDAAIAFRVPKLTQKVTQS